MYTESTRVWGSLHGGMCARYSMRGRSGGGSDRKWTGASWREEVVSGEGWLFIETAEGGRKFIRAAIFLRDGRSTAACWRLRVHPSIQSDSLRGELALERNFLKGQSGSVADGLLTKLRGPPVPPPRQIAPLTIYHSITITTAAQRIVETMDGTRRPGVNATSYPWSR